MFTHINAFHTGADAIKAAIRSQLDLQSEDWGGTPIRVRCGIHTGKADRQENGQYTGYMTLSRVQRLMSAGHGGQVLVSAATEQLVRDDLPEGAGLHDLGEHRLKDLVRPEHIYQIVAANLPAEFPPLKTLDLYFHNLPVQLTSFIGREKEIAEVKAALREHRQVTLTGSGGTGKTRLSLQVAADILEEFPDGVWLLELAPVTDPGLVPNTLANLLGLRESAETKQSISELICGYLQSRKALLVFDNCEHLIESCAKLSDLLLRSCKNVKILASSREALGVSGEMAWHVPSLSLPDINHLPPAEQLAHYEGVRLFIERASLVQPRIMLTQDNADAIAQICLRLDGIPLAIELAAARANVLTVDQIAKRLDDRFRLLTGGARTALPRQQTLRAMIDWSYNLLSEEERLLFRRLAVFVGGWTLEAAEAVCSGQGIESHRVLDLLSQLVKKSLVVMLEQDGEARYHSLETIRQYGREKLFDTDEAAPIRNRHLDYLIRTADQGYEELRGPNDLGWIDKLETENDNLRSALSWSLDSPETDPQKALQISGAMQDFWDTRGYTSEGFHWLSSALKKAPDSPTSARCRALSAAGLLGIRLSRFKDAIIYLEDALILARQLNIASLIIINLAYSANIMENRVEARKRFQEGIALARTTQNPDYLALLLAAWAMEYSDNAPETIRCVVEAQEIAENLGNARLRAYILWAYGGIEMRRSNYDSADSMIQEALRWNQLLRDKHSTAHCLLFLGRIATRQTSYDTALQYEDQCLRMFRDLSDRTCTVHTLFHLGWNAYLSGDTDRALNHFQECHSICREIDIADLIGLPSFAIGRIAVSRGDLHAAKQHFLEALQAFKQTLDSPFFIAYCLEAVCAISILSPEKAARLMGQAKAIRDNHAFVIPIAERHLVEPIVERLQAQLGKEAFDAASAGGMKLTMGQAIDDAIEVLQVIQ